MAMTVGSGDEEEVPMSDINVVPFTDVMLVLVIIFLIAVPVAIQTVPISLPKVRYEATTTKPENVSLIVRNGSNGTCEVYWGMQRVNQKELLDRGVKKLSGLVLAENAPMLRLTASLGFTPPRPTEEGVVAVDLAL